MLAGLVQNPDANNPVDNQAAALDRRDVVLNRMSELDLITAGQVKKAKKAGFDKDEVKPTLNGCVGTTYPFLCDYVRRSLLTLPSLGKTQDERENMLNRGGLTIQTAIDPKTQDLAQKKVSSVVGPKDPLISTMNMIQPGTGLIVAMAQSRPVMGNDDEKGETYWNLAADPAMGGIQGYQAGSTFKAFTMAAALEKGIPISKKFNAKSPMDFSGKTVRDLRGHASTVYGKYKVKNSVGHSKKIDMTEAAEWSVNTYFVQLELAAGMCNVTKMAQKIGVEAGHARNRDIVEYYQTQPVLHPGHGRGQPAVDGRGVRDLRRPRHPLQPDHRVQDHQPERQEARGPRRRLQARHRQGRGRRRQQGPQGRDQEGHRHPGAVCRRPRPGRQDRHDRQQRGRLVRGLHAQDRRRRDDLDRQQAEALHQEASPASAGTA